MNLADEVDCKYTCVCVYVCMCVYMYVCIYIYIYMHTHKLCMYIYIYICTRTNPIKFYMQVEFANWIFGLNLTVHIAIAPGMQRFGSLCIYEYMHVYLGLKHAYHGHVKDFASRSDHIPNASILRCMYTRACTCKHVHQQRTLPHVRSTFQTLVSCAVCIHAPAHVSMCINRGLCLTFGPHSKR
jgi:hypothetical protein